MLSDSMQKALNQQLNMELYSAYYYLSAAAHFENEELLGFASWTKHQAQEEVDHARRIYQYINDAGGRVLLEAIDKPPHEFQSALAIVEGFLEHEQKVTKSIHDLVEQANKEKDHATGVFLQWFVTEQVEEEATAGHLVRQVKRCADSPQALLLLDHKLGQRQSGAHD